jgi:GT2 family glycosyltransferase
MVEKNNSNRQNNMSNIGPKIMIGLPAAADSFIGETVEALMNMKVTPSCFTKVFGGEAVDKARNALVKIALEQGVDYLLFVDADNPPPINTLAVFLEADKDIVCAPVLSRHPPFVPCVFKKEVIPNNTVPGYAHLSQIDTTGGTLVKIDACGMACTLIKRKVLEALYLRHEGRPFEFSRVPIQPVDGKDKRDMSEDVTFCERATEAGFTIWCDTTIRPLHFAGKKWVQFNDSMLL